jgi:hypothetical protein
VQVLFTSCSIILWIVSTYMNDTEPIWMLTVQGCFGFFFSLDFFYNWYLAEDRFLQLSFNLTFQSSLPIQSRLVSRYCHNHSSNYPSSSHNHPKLPNLQCHIHSFCSLDSFDSHSSDRKRRC